MSKSKPVNPTVYVVLAAARKKGESVRCLEWRAILITTHPVCAAKAMRDFGGSGVAGLSAIVTFGTASAPYVSDVSTFGVAFSDYRDLHQVLSWMSPRRYWSMVEEVARLAQSEIIGSDLPPLMQMQATQHGAQPTGPAPGDVEIVDLTGPAPAEVRQSDR